MGLRGTGPGLIRLLVATGCLAAGVSPARALTDEEIFRGFPFEFIAPGPRALALGGSFVALADDATAAHYNPAGLYALPAAHLLVEYRSIRPDDPEPLESSVGSLAVDPVTGDRDLPYLRLTSVSEPESTGVIGFLGFVYPFSVGRQNRTLSLAGSRQVLVSDERTLPSSGSRTETQFSFDSFPNTVSNGQVVAYSVLTPVSGESTTDIVYWNATASYEFHRDFSLGLTLSYATLDLKMSTATEVIDPLALYLDPVHPRLPIPPPYVYRSAIDDSDKDVAYAVGVHWHPGTSFPGGTSPFALGAVFRKGARLEATESTFVNDVPDRTFSNQIVVPDAFALGGSYRFAAGFRVTAEVERVEYSDQLEGYRSGVNFFTSGRVTDVSLATDPNKAVTYTVDDGIVLKAGFEYALALGGQGERALDLRAGFYRSPDRQIRMQEFNSTDPQVNAMYEQAFPAGEDHNHFTAGVGFRLGASSFHLAGETSDSGSQIAGGYALSWGSR